MSLVTQAPQPLNMTSTPPMNVSTPAPVHSESTVIGVVIALLLVTLAVVGFLLYRYLCHNKGAYRTTGEPAPGEDFAEDHKPNQTTNDKKEYFI